MQPIRLRDGGGIGRELKVNSCSVFFSYKFIQNSRIARRCKMLITVMIPLQFHLRNLPHLSCLASHQLVTTSAPSVTRRIEHYVFLSQWPGPPRAATTIAKVSAFFQEESSMGLSFSPECSRVSFLTLHSTGCSIDRRRARRHKMNVFSMSCM